MIRRKMGGQLMVEILVGLGVITMALVASLVAVTHASRLARASRNKLEATRYGEQVLESLRNTRDQDKEGFFANAICPSCEPFVTGTVYGCTFSVCEFSPTRADVTVKITWDDGGNDVSISMPTVLTLYDL